MQVLLPAASGPPDLHDWYAADWIERGGIRADMIASADGAAAADGLTAGLQTPGDNLVFRALRDLADIVVVGWSTARAEDYAPIALDADRRALRARYDLAPHLPVALISRSLSMPDDSALLGSADTVVVTCEASDAARRSELAERVTVIVCGDEQIDYAAMRHGFDERGWTRVLCEGGPTILSQVIRDGELDELCLSVTPFAAGPGAVRVVAGDEWQIGPRRLRLRGLLEDDGALFARYALDR